MTCRDCRAVRRARYVARDDNEDIDTAMTTMGTRTVARGDFAGWIPRSGIETVDEHYLGAMDKQCTHCGALHWLEEKLQVGMFWHRVILELIVSLQKSLATDAKFGKCCTNGQIDFPARDPLPPFLSWRLEGTVDGDGNRVGPDAIFRKHVRQYNNAFQFTSVKCNINTHGLNATGPIDFQIHGSLYHFSGPLEPVAGETAAFAQLYFYDAQSAADIRGNNNLRG